MKTIKINSLIVFLSSFSFLLCAVAACDSENDGDTTRPVIRIIAPAEDAYLLIGDEEGVLFEAEFSDDIQLASYKIDIHYAGDGHTHTRHGDGGGKNFLNLVTNALLHYRGLVSRFLIEIS
ncbi:MAG: DUF4625 domain-containing protein [Bacteroides sp.]|nr:DUF4625 domain-containing protein [Bacteroides sp.]